MGMGPLLAIGCPRPITPYQEVAPLSGHSLVEGLCSAEGQLVSKYGYPSETHTLTTSDGYVLNMHRIPYSRKSPNVQKRPAVFVQHGMMGSSADYVIPGPESSLAYLLADAGYDVFLGNCRGNTYSKKHVSLTPTDLQYWDFSWHEMAMFDVTAQIDHILRTTNQSQVYYIGMSMGTTLFFALMSERPEYNQKVKLMVALAPIAYFDRMSKSIILTRNMSAPMLQLASTLQLREIQIPKWINELWSESLCPTWLGFNTCLNKFYMGIKTSDLNYLNKHWDYGLEENLLKYKQEDPPEYNVAAITTPIAFLYSQGDELSSVNGAENLCTKVQNCAELYQVPRNNFKHMDFVLGLAVDAKTLIYDKILELLSKH
ncbi:Lipase 3 [Blattella germanica]|nr:Lipase 3 [Blattella germanica]